MLFEVKTMNDTQHDAPVAAIRTRNAYQPFVPSRRISIGDAVEIAQRKSSGDVCAVFLEKRGSVITLRVRSDENRNPPGSVIFITLDCRAARCLGFARRAGNAIA